MGNIKNGILKNSKTYFYSPSKPAKNLFYYPLCAGHFYCSGDYSVKRSKFDSIILIYIVEGSLSFMQGSAQLTAFQGETAIINCYHPHHYFANENLESYWVHIGGVNSQKLYKEITRRNGSIIKNNKNVFGGIIDLYNCIKESAAVNDYNMSLKTYSLIASLFDGSCENIKAKSGKIIDGAKKYIYENIEKKISVTDIATSVHMSESQFSRVFRKQIGISPYEYVISVKHTKAKDLLINTDLSIGEVAYKTGFSSEANFIYSFKNKEGVSPLKFRKITLNNF